jgi:hypothetical protein
MKYPLDLKPSSTEPIALPAGGTVHVPKATPLFKPWKGAAPSDRYGGKQLLRWRRQPAFAELVVLWTLQAAGWRGVWIDSYRRCYRIRYWGTEPVLLPAARQRLLDLLRAGTRERGGAWDVYCWRGSRVLFAELKRVGRDRIRLGQRLFLQAALEHGLTLDAFLIVEWAT